MEMLEMELIKKLQHTQAIQKQAYSELEDALQQKGQNSSYMTGGVGAFGKMSGVGSSKNGVRMNGNGVTGAQDYGSTEGQL